ncbi:hypothetical protein B484DRAFT_429964 [Ochromonadaceae sp. CCMP2298]|nr:hypothetical protein B484DRAFT_429964 [Ochromonadaceae sp. CCMP2298]|mmetsp:Transcript_7471/g.16384  ORF Transcript_7471/g.16384 Transcript_7471/m.16384 type:complete len:659 (-) Transcript_7471:264-2240(-)|eukprot:CAMPEP_0173182012 /NCGR_PEP_ID=MMETSP1141-20130122/7599_1 /TAXON_ID=483371 /ORGANISM="non described non described, Strain CCMP2298" /LENGTH=658 /DNA_ID=CAMNT_0014105055 /DNA_START=77 /DNA_END=2053 /DNA_ORIENTATION=-
MQVAKHDLSALVPKGLSQRTQFFVSKPDQAHRVIKDRAQSLFIPASELEKRSALAPLLSDNIRYIQGGPSALLRNDGGGVPGADTKDHLRLRIKELEKENGKLSLHIREAEMSIQSYRGNLSEKGPRMSRGVSAGTQTDADNKQAGLRALQEKLNASTEELRSLQDMKDTMFRERKQLQEVGRKKEQALAATVELQAAEVMQLQKSLAAAQAVIAENVLAEKVQKEAQREKAQKEEMQREVQKVEVELQVELQVVKEELMKEEVLKEEVAVSNSVSAQQRAQAACLQQSMEALRNLRQEMDVFKTGTVEMAAVLQQSVQADFARILGVAAAHAQEQDRLLREARAGAQSQTEALHLAEEELAALLHHVPVPLPQPKELSIAHLSMSPPLRTRSEVCTPAPPLVEVGCSPSSPMGNREVVEAQLRAKVAEQAAEVDKLLQRCRNDHKLIVEKERENDRLTQRYMVDLDRINQHERELLGVAGGAAEEQLRAEHYRHRLMSAVLALNGLQEVHAAEVKAVKHEAHVKDLLRVAKEREASIERDRLAIELKFIKEVQSILTFSLNTAEQSLSEAQPHVVAKLVQGRLKRLKLLEQSTHGRLRDLDQRSADTCAVNSAHLDAFKQKAATNNAAAKEMTHAATKKLLAILRESGGGNMLLDGT